MSDMNPNVKFDELIIICNGCGQPMQNMGEWPITYPRPKETVENYTQTLQNVQRASRYSCMTCRTPHAEFSKGIPVMVAIIEGFYE